MTTMTITQAVDGQTAEQVIWESPPRLTGKNKGNPSVRRQAMLDNPGKWLLWADSAYPSTGNHLRKGGFQVTTRAIPGTNKVRVYARWPKARAAAAARQMATA